MIEPFLFIRAHTHANVSTDELYLFTVLTHVHIVFVSAGAG